MASTSEDREGRRRRIAERGSDRMALITGQINQLPPPPPPPPTSPASPSIRRHHLPPRHVRPESLPPALSTEFQPDYRASQSFSLPAAAEDKPDASRFSSRLRHQSGFKFSRRLEVESLKEESDTNAEGNNQVRVDDVDDAKTKPSSGDAEDKFDFSSSSTRLRHQAGFKFSKRNNFKIKSEVEPVIQNSETNAEAKHQLSVDDNTRIKPSSDTIRAQNIADVKKKLPQPVRHRPTFFSSRELNSSIIASETTRAFCALTIALLVVFSYKISKRIVATRPLCAVLITDITIVLARLYLGKIRNSEEAEGESVEANENGHDWQGVKLLERSLVAYQALRGVFIDCSVYVVVVVCGLSLM